MDRRITKTRTAIINAYLTLIMENHSTKITITDIAKQADIDRKTFYLHYDSIDAVIHDFGQRKIDELLKILEVNHFFENPFDSSYFFASLNQLIEPDLEFFRHIAAKPSYAFFWNQIKDILKNTLTKEYETRLTLSQTTLELYGELYSSGILAVYLRWMRNELPFSMEELEQAVGEAAYYGLQRPMSQRKPEES